MAWARSTERAARRRGDETRARLLNAAREQFADDGYDGASLRMIAASADLTPALLHYRFGSKRDPYRAVWVEQYSSEDERARRSAYVVGGTDESREQALRRVIEAAINGPVHLLQDKRGGEFIAILARELADPKAAERGLLAEFINPVSDATRLALREIMSHLSNERFESGLLMTIGAAQQLIHYSTLSAIHVDVGSPERLSLLVPAIVRFMVAGWLSLEE